MRPNFRKRIEMKKFLLGVFALFFVACSQTSSVISLNPYLSKADQTVSGKSVNINAINDQRENQMVIAVINDNDGKLVDEVLLKNNLSAWFDQALRAELEARGVRIDPASPNIVTVNIRSISAAINGYSKENMSARGEIAISIVQGNKTTTKRVSQDQSQFTALRTARSLNPFVQSLLDDIVKKSADQIISTL